MTAPTVIADVTGRLGCLTLNRPAAINALTTEMVAILHRTLDAWATAPEIRAVLISGAGERGLCAGGDLRSMHADAVSGGTGTLDFFATEYRLNAAIAAYPKPVVAFMDGLVMGGGIGVSAHASIRVVTERSRLAMPEVGIGLHPDVGGSWLLSHAPGQLGTHLALTGATIGAADAITAGLADHHVPADRLPALRDALRDGDPAAAVAAAATPPPPGDLDGARPWIDSCYAADTVAEIVDRLAAHPSPAAQAAAKEIGTKSPTSLVVTLRSLRTAAGLPGMREALDQEYRLSAALLRLPDLAEGIRAQIIDKDRRPRWNPATLAEVSPAVVDACFAG
ncbi:enoyl-CoA hydratase/isomerase family protein [Actinoplanes utahensis]|uniref:3-hydroxyisobutyryl-CoA hydrolase n=1 Tax=Actinoplanes utahensis TaxID=1869 RepID=A0A0A6UQL6_ACTUT|nr:3-hydroxyisobutyryl-CoA hydrolase [Actinoplanes utahensis]GIF32978.1 putative enoyl-CoA hydratase [Actinoplanes utahensis]